MLEVSTYGTKFRRQAAHYLGEIMKDIAAVVLAAALVLAMPHAMASTGYGTAGCGLGSIAYGAKPGMVQAIASILNITGMQSFGISSGTSNCIEKPGSGEEQDGEKEQKKHKKKKNTGSVPEQTDFIANNLNTLKRDAAQGYGDALAALASILGCDVKVYPQLTRRLQVAHAKVFGTEDAAKVLAAIKDQVAAQPSLSEACDIGGGDLARVD